MHRVPVPSDPSKASLVRRSITYFANADDDVLLRKMEYANDDPEKVTNDSATEYITSKEYLMRRFKNSYY